MTDENKPVALVVVDGDLRFDLEVAGKWHTFRISREALEDLDGITGDFDREAVFWKHEAKICAVARKLVAAGVTDQEILLRTEFFG